MEIIEIRSSNFFKKMSKSSSYSNKILGAYNLEGEKGRV
jgi:hypothetical protein